MTQLFVIVQVFVPQGQPVDSLRQHLLDGVFYQGGVATIQEALAKARQQFHSLVSLPQQQSAGIRSHGSTVELRHYLPAEVSSK